MAKRYQASIKLFALGCLLLLASSANAAVNLVVNGDFETGNLNGWTLMSDGSDFSGIISGTVHSGGSAAYFSSFLNTLTQTIDLATTPGQAYEISFWLYCVGGGSNMFDAKFANASLNGLPLVNLPNDPTFINHTFHVVATGSTSTLEFDFLNRPEGGGVFVLDDVSVTALSEAAALPEVASLTIWGLLGGAIGFVGFLRRRRKALAV
jgi:hypothetical protein